MLLGIALGYFGLNQRPDHLANRLWKRWKPYLRGHIPSESRVHTLRILSAAGR